MLEHRPTIRRHALANGGYSISGKLRWASNLYPDSLMVTAARTPSGERIIFGLTLDSEGIALGKNFSLLALGSTASSFMSLDNVVIRDEQVLSSDFENFIATARPTFLVLQSAMCLGLARRCIGEAQKGLKGVNEIFAPEVDGVLDELKNTSDMLEMLAVSVGTDHPPTKKDLLTLRLRAAQLATSASALEVRTAGGKGYARSTPTSRRFRESTFIPVQSPSESQLRWELDRCE